MGWLIIDAATHEIIEQQDAGRPPVVEGRYSVPLPASGYPDTLRWDSGDRSFAPVMTDADRRAEVRARRDRAEWGGCATALGRVDTDPDSQRKVSGAVQLAMIAQTGGHPFALSWTMADDSDVLHDAPAMVGLGVAVGQHVAACHAVARAKMAAIEAGEAVDIEGGWPGA